MKSSCSDARFSLVSSGTEESLLSACVATPPDLSPCMPASSGMITIVAADSHSDQTQLPMVVSRRLPRHQQEYGISPDMTSTPYRQQELTGPRRHRAPSSGRSTSHFWPRVKKMLDALGSSFRESSDSHGNAVGTGATDQVLPHQQASVEVFLDRPRTKRTFFPNNNKSHVQPWSKG